MRALGLIVTATLLTLTVAACNPPQKDAASAELNASTDAGSTDHGSDDQGSTDHGSEEK